MSRIHDQKYPSAELDPLVEKAIGMVGDTVTSDAETTTQIEIDRACSALKLTPSQRAKVNKFWFEE